MAQNDGPGETTLFIQKMDGELLGWDHPAARLREALDGEDLVLWAQPVVRLAPEPESDRRAAGSIVMAEVLVRLREVGSRLLPPGDFLPAFEHYGMMVELDRWVLRQALRRLGAGGGLLAAGGGLLAAGGGLTKLSVNVSSQTIEEPGFGVFVAAQLRMASLAASALVIEIHENDALDRPGPAQRFAAELKGIGCGLLLDGFARRSMSFEPLRTLRADFVKVDGTLVRNIRRSAGAAAKLKAILRAGALAGVEVIAECVEDDKILSALQLLKMGYAQGFGVGKPQPIDELLKS
jgi:EAL domain-containing protein (putative c-di-GMP-specific phosphodiesterase class I)